MADHASWKMYNAINLFIASPTGRGRKLDKTLRQFLGQVNIVLTNHYKQKSIQLRPNLSCNGQKAFGCLSGGVLQLDTRLDLPGLSNWMVHEAGHTVLQARRYPLLDQELWIRTLQLWYYYDLLQGGWRYYHFDGEKKIRIAPRVMDSNAPWVRDMRSMAQNVRQSGLIDVVLSTPAYKNYLYEAWVKQNLDREGGVKKRLSTTLVLFVKVLLKNAANPSNAKAIKKIVDETAHNPNTTHEYNSKTVAQIAHSVGLSVTQLKQIGR